MARGRFEPDELLDFLSGRLASAYITSRADVDRRLAGHDLRPDPEGRYRVNEFFCRADTWQPTVTKLMEQSDLVAMDLRAESGRSMPKTLIASSDGSRRPSVNGS